jgi:hypothetical protein
MARTDSLRVANSENMSFIHDVALYFSGNCEKQWQVQINALYIYVLIVTFRMYAFDLYIHLLATKIYLRLTAFHTVIIAASNFVSIYLYYTT